MGHFYLGASRRAWLWAAIPPLAFVALCVGIMHARADYALLAPGVALIALARVYALVDVFRVPVAGRRPPLLGWLAFTLVANACTFGAWIYVSEDVAQPYRVFAFGMEPTLGRAHLLVAKNAFRDHAPKYGQLAMLRDRKEPPHLQERRILGLPGDRVELADNELTINGWTVPHCTIAERIELLEGDKDSMLLVSHGSLELEFLGAATYLVYHNEQLQALGQKPHYVAAGEVLALGDNRNQSEATLFFEDHEGDVPLENLFAEPVFTWLPFTPEGGVDWPRVNTRLDEPHLPKALASLEPALRACLAKRPSATEPPSAH